MATIGAHLALVAIGTFSGSALAWDPANTSVTSDDAAVVITGLSSTGRHMHGGAPARLGMARYTVQYRGKEPAELTVERVRFLTGRDCEQPPKTVASEPVLGGLFTDGMDESALALTLKPKSEREVWVGFTEVDAYYVHCDRFAFEVGFRVGDRSLVVVAETNITREEPLRRGPDELP